MTFQSALDFNLLETFDFVNYVSVKIVNNAKLNGISLRKPVETRRIYKRQ